MTDEDLKAAKALVECSSMVDWQARAPHLVPRLLAEVERLRAELAAMQPVVDAAVAYGIAPSDCLQSEVALVHAAGMYHANRMVQRDETDEELQARCINHYGMWGAYCTAVMETHGEELDHLARERHGLTRRKVTK